jgi:hypothetical protein
VRICYAIVVQEGDPTAGRCADGAVVSAGETRAWVDEVANVPPLAEPSSAVVRRGVVDDEYLLRLRAERREAVEAAGKLRRSVARGNRY